MKIGVVGLGKVGVVLAQTLRYIGGHEVIGYDTAPADEIFDRVDRPMEPLPKGALSLAADMRTVILASDIVYICVATPNVEYDSLSPHSINAEDFDYTALLDAVTAVSQEASKQQKRITLVVLSTVAPGTFDEHIYDAIEQQWVSLVYSPSFISLGTIWDDLVSPQAILIGADNPVTSALISGVWEPITDARRITVSIESAEIIKMASNTIQFFKIQYINALAALAEKTSADIDEVSEGLAKVLNHGWIPKAGMPDGGACRPRDVAAMTAIADNRYVSDLWMLMRALDNARKTQFDRMALEIQRLADRFPDLPILILGDAYKAGVTYSDGSPGKYLLRSLHPATKRSVSLVPGPFNENSKFLDKAIYVVAVPYPVDLRRFPMGSVVYDVWGMTTDDPNLEVTYISPGRFPHA